MLTVLQQFFVQVSSRLLPQQLMAASLLSFCSSVLESVAGSAAEPPDVTLLSPHSCVLKLVRQPSDVAAALAPAPAQLCAYFLFKGQYSAWQPYHVAGLAAIS
jgi:hypothetical protein